GDGAFHRFETLFEPGEGRLGVVVTFLSILELAKERLIDSVQEPPLAPIYLKSLAGQRPADEPREFSSEFDDPPADATEGRGPRAATPAPRRHPSRQTRRMDQQFINRIVEAALLASSQPLTVVQLSGLCPLDEPAPEGSIQAALEALQADCEGRGIELVEVASGWRYQVRADVHPWVARLWTERQTRYTRATLETLALIAYRQPITRGEIEQVRGVATSSNIIKALEEREWIRVV